MTSQNEYRLALEAACPGSPAGDLDIAASFGDWLNQQNKIQNLTRMSSPADFANSHFADTQALLESGWLSGHCVDLGSGCGVPGLLAAALRPKQRWTLIESELRKAEHLTAGVKLFHVEQSVKIEHARIERILQSIPATTIVARALGKVGKIWGWTRKCSTWNSLVLFKSKGWEAEWSEFQATPDAKHLTIAEVKDYSSLGNCRLLIRLIRR